MFSTIANLLILGLLSHAEAAPPAPLTPTIAEPPAIIAPERVYDNAFDVEISAANAIVVDEQSRRILYSRDIDTPRSIASITKLMTALVFLEHNPGWDMIVTIHSADHRPGASPDLFVGDELSVRAVFDSMLIASSNEAAVALARVSGLPEEAFIAAMNQKASQLGLSQMKFNDVTGLDSNNIATARELATLALVAFSHADIVNSVTSDQREVVTLAGNSRKLVATDTALGTPFGADGRRYVIEAGKTGYVDAAGYCFASRSRDGAGRRLITVVLGSDTISSRFQDTKALVHWTFNNYRWR